MDDAAKKALFAVKVALEKKGQVGLAINTAGELTRPTHKGEDSKGWGSNQNRIVLAKLDFASSLFSFRQSYDQITVRGVDAPRSYKSAMRSQGYTSKKAGWPIDKIVARIEAADAMRGEVASVEAGLKKAELARAREYASASKAVRSAKIGAALDLELGERPRLTIKWDNVPAEKVERILEALAGVE